MTSVEDSEAATICVGAAVSAKFRGAFCEANVSEVERRAYCRLTLEGGRRTIKVRSEDVRGSLIPGAKVQADYEGTQVSGILIKVMDNSLYHVVFNDGDTCILRRNQLLLKGDRHYKLSECLDILPLTNPEDFKKSVVNEKRGKEKIDVDEDEEDEIKSCSQESMTTVSSSKTRSRRRTVASSASVDTAGSSTTIKIIEDVNKNPIKITKPKKMMKSKYLIGSLVIVNNTIVKLEEDSECLNASVKPFIGIIISSLSFGCNHPSIKLRQCAVKSFRDNYCYVAYKRDVEVVTKRDILIKYKECDPSCGNYIEKCAIYFDLKILPDDWDTEKLLVSSNYHENIEQTPTKIINKSKPHSPRTSISSLDSSSNGADNSDDVSEHSNEEDQNAKDEWVARFYGFWEDKGSPINNALEIAGKDVDIYKLYELVKDYGGFQKVNSHIRWPYFYHLMKLPFAISDNYQKLQILYKKFIFPYVDMKKKLGTFEQIRNRRLNDPNIINVKKARPLLSARERREYQSSIKKAEECSVSSQSQCERIVEKVVSGDEVGTSSAIGDMYQLSQCSSSPKHALEKNLDGEDDTTSIIQHRYSTLPPGTVVSVSYGSDKVYKAKIISQYIPGDVMSSRSSRSPLFSKTMYPTVFNMDCTSNAGSTCSTINDQRFELEGSTLYKVHYIGWNTRHDEIVASDRILSVLSDTGHDSQSMCSSRDSHNITHLSDTEHSLPISQPQLEESTAAPIIDDNEMPPDICDVSHDVDLLDSYQVEDTDSKPELFVNEECEESTIKEEIEDGNTTVAYIIDEISRRRSRSECITIELKSVPQESRIIASLNLYKVNDTMPQRPPTKSFSPKNEMIEVSSKVKEEIEDTVPIQGIKRQCNSGDESESYSKVTKLDFSSMNMQIGLRSPFYSNESVSDASTISFRLADIQSSFYLSVDDEEYCLRKTERKSTKVNKTRGRKRVYNYDKKTLGPIIKKNKTDTADHESNSSQHSGSAQGKRVTRSLKIISDQNVADDSLLHFEEDSQTSQDGSGFQLPSYLPLDFRPSMTPLAAGTPTSSKGRRPKGRRKYRNSQSNSSAECAYQDGVVEMNSCPGTENFTQSKTSTQSPTPGNVHNRPPGRIFQRLHPSLIPHDLQKFSSEERIKLLESLVRQTHINFLDIKDKLKYVDKRLSEIKSSRANGHCIESDEDKFR